MNNKYCAFTICSKNYLAQAFVLKESFCTHNPDKDFYIFLADKIDTSVERFDEVIQLSATFIPKWEEMAFKYGVIEFNTSIKPFCIKKLFSQGYEKVIYLDPDIYVLDSLDSIYNDLREKHMVLTPHCTHIQNNFTGAVTEEELLFVGIYNLGFCAIKNSDIGNQITEWWMKRLEERCFADKNDALHVDQKWIDFLPGFFPNELEISHNLGYDVAIWNLFERELIIKDSKYFIKDTFNGRIFPLIFFHFSGFDPYNKTVLNRRQPTFNTNIYPSYIPLISEYSEREYANGYDYYSKLQYGFQTFDNGNQILPFHRRLFSELIKTRSFENPFDESGDYYKILKRNKLLSKFYGTKTTLFQPPVKGKSKKYRYLCRGLKLLKRLLGIDNYLHFINILPELARYKNQLFLLDGAEKC